MNMMEYNEDLRVGNDTESVFEIRMMNWDLKLVYPIIHQC